MASICRYVDTNGTVVFKKGLGKEACTNIGGDDAQWYKDEWKPYTFQIPGTPIEDQFPRNAQRDATLELRNREALRNSIWTQEGEEDLIRQQADFGFSPNRVGYYANQPNIAGTMTVPPQPEGYDFSSGSIWERDMLDRTKTNYDEELARVKKNWPTGVDGGYSLADAVSEMPPNRAGGSGFEKIPYYQHPANTTFAAGGSASDYSRTQDNQGKLLGPTQEDIARMMEDEIGPNWKETIRPEDLEWYNSRPREFTAGATYRGSDEYAEQPGARASYMQAQNLGGPTTSRPSGPPIGWNNISNRIEEERAPGIGLDTGAVSTGDPRADQNLFNLARMEMEKGPDVGLADYVPPVNLEQREEDQALFDIAKAKGLTRAEQKILQEDVVQHQKQDDAADVMVGNLEKAQIDGVEVTDKEHWWETPDTEFNQIIADSGFAEWLDSMEDYGGNWSKNFIKGLKTNWENQEYFTIAGKLWLGGKGLKWGGKLLWSLVPFKKGSKLTPNLIKVAIAGEIYQISTDMDSDVPFLEQIQIKVNEIMEAMSGGAAGGPEVVEGDGEVTVDKTTKDTPRSSALDAVDDPSLWGQLATSNIPGAADATTGILNTGTAQQQGYSGNIGDMFSNLFNPNPETMDYWYKQREGDIPGNNRMREAMARLAYMGLYPEDRGTDPYRLLSDDRIAYTNNLLDAASSQATLNATAVNRQYQQWKDMLPTQAELAKELVESKSWRPWGMNQDDLDRKSQKDAGSLLRRFKGLMAKGVAPTPDNLRVASFLEDNGIEVTGESVNYAIQNGALEEIERLKNEGKGGGNTQTSTGAVKATKAFISSIKAGLASQFAQ